MEGKINSLTNFTDYNSVNGIISKMITKLANEINNQKEIVILKKIEEKLGIKIDFQEEKKRRFSRFIIEDDGEKETVYFNDNSMDGIRIVTFVRKDNPFMNETDRLEMSVKYDYY